MEVRDNATLCRQAFMNTLIKGDRNSIYPVLAYVLTKLPQLKKRAYVAKYLMALEVPPEFMHDEGVMVRTHRENALTASSCNSLVCRMP
jgi:hypothetical protein